MLCSTHKPVEWLQKTWNILFLSVFGVWLPHVIINCCFIRKNLQIDSETSRGWIPFYKLFLINYFLTVFNVVIQCYLIKLTKWTSGFTLSLLCILIKITNPLQFMPHTVQCNCKFHFLLSCWSCVKTLPLGTQEENWWSDWWVWGCWQYSGLFEEMFELWNSQMDLKLAAPSFKMIVLTDHELRDVHNGRFNILHIEG